MVGKDGGKSGKISEIDTKKNSVLVPGLNMFKKHKKPQKQGEKGQIISISRSIPIGNVQLLCGSCNRPTRVGFRFEGDPSTHSTGSGQADSPLRSSSYEGQAGQRKKVRFCKRCKVAV